VVTGEEVADDQLAGGEEPGGEETPLRAGRPGRIEPGAPDSIGSEGIPDGLGANAKTIDQLLEVAGVTKSKALYRSVFATVLDLVEANTDTLDLKIAAAALAEMAEAFRVFMPYRDARKATFFGSARTLPEDPLYIQARKLAAKLSTQGWMVVTGAGPGIMAAAMEGAGRERSLGVNIRLPHEQGANEFIAQDPKLVEMRYFFTRKLMLIKESQGYAVLPGGFGTQDEAFELLTLLQTGKAQPAPLVLLDVHEGNYWEAWSRFVHNDLEARGLISPEDHSLYKVTTHIDEAAEEILGFYRNYHSCRWVGDLFVIRLLHAPSAEQLAELTREFDDIIVEGRIRVTKPLAPERSGNDNVELPRIAFRFDRIHFGRLRMLIDALNALVD
jgi:uncharacterized protein (TIGR00730 family)